MVRTARIVVKNFPHLVTQRGIRSIAIFADDKDRKVYLKCMSESAAKHRVSFLAWCLMSDHVHLVAVPGKQESLAKAIGEAHWRYARYVNFREGVRGSLFQGRFESYPVQRDAHLLAVMRYVELTPVKAGLVRRAEEWPWSSARFNLKRRKHDTLVHENTAEAFDRSWRKILTEGQEDTDIRRIEQHIGTGRPYGDNRWLKRLEVRTGRSLKPKPIGWPKGKPRKKHKRNGGVK